LRALFLAVLWLPISALAAEPTLSPRDVFLTGGDVTLDSANLAELEHACAAGALGPCRLPIGPLACRRLGELHHDRDTGTPGPETEKARSFFTRAAEAGDAVAAYRLSLMLDDPKDAARADALLREACDEKKRLDAPPAADAPRLVGWSMAAPPDCAQIPPGAVVRVIGDPDRYREGVDEACAFLAQHDDAPSPLGPVRVGGGVKEPRKIRHVDPVYPPEAEQAHVEGSVVLEVTVDRAGLVSDIKVLRSVPMLDQAAMHAVGEWVYEPTLVNGAPVSVITTVTVSFRLDPKQRRR
jgi:TonB family protein